METLARGQLAPKLRLSRPRRNSVATPTIGSQVPRINRACDGTKLGHPETVKRPKKRVRCTKCEAMSFFKAKTLALHSPSRGSPGRHLKNVDRGREMCASHASLDACGSADTSTSCVRLREARYDLVASRSRRMDLTQCTNKMVTFALKHYL